MSATTRTPRAPARPTLPSRPVPTTAERQLTQEQENSRRLRDAYRDYVFARYEWLRLKAIGLGYLTPAGYKPLPMNGTEQLSDVGAKSKRLQEWLRRNESDEGEAPLPPAQQPEPTATSEAEPKRWPIPPVADPTQGAACAVSRVRSADGVRAHRRRQSRAAQPGRHQSLCDLPQSRPFSIQQGP